MSQTKISSILGAYTNAENHEGYNNDSEQEESDRLGYPSDPYGHFNEQYDDEDDEDNYPLIEDDIQPMIFNVMTKQFES